MPRTSTGARERFIYATLTLLRQGGLSAAGLNEVVSLAQAPKGSMYHYFPAGKTQMVATALETYKELVASQITQALQGRSMLRRRVTKLFEAVAHRMSDAQFGQSCAVGAVVLDLKPVDTILHQSCSAALTHWAETAAALLHELPSENRLAAGRHLVTLLEGAQLAARAAGNSAPLQEAAEAFLAYTQSFLKAPS